MLENDFETDSYLRIAALSVALYEWVCCVIYSKTAYWSYDYLAAISWLYQPNGGFTGARARYYISGMSAIT